MIHNEIKTTGANASDTDDSGNQIITQPVFGATSCQVLWSPVSPVFTVALFIVNRGI